MFARSRVRWPMRLSASWRLVSEAVPSAIVVYRLAAQQRLGLRRRSTGVAAQDRRLAPVGRTGTGTLAVASVAHGRGRGFRGVHWGRARVVDRRRLGATHIHRSSQSAYENAGWPHRLHTKVEIL